MKITPPYFPVTGTKSIRCPIFQIKERFEIFLHCGCLSHMNFISTNGNGWVLSENCLCLSPLFLYFKYRLNRQQSHSSHAAPIFHLMRIFYYLSHHLIAAADPNNPALLLQPADGSFQSALPQPFQIIHRIFRSRKENDIRFSKFFFFCNITHGYVGIQFQGGKICKI